MGSFASTPGFELYRRGLNAQTIKQFRGINAFQAHTVLGPEWALDCLNVMVPGWGGLSKFRLPVAISAALAPNPVNGPYQFVDFQTGLGVRQVVASFPDNSLWYFAWNAAGTALNPGVLIEAAAPDAPPWSMVESNNILFMANGIRMMKWTGTSFQAWGIAAPLVGPRLGGVYTGANVGNITADGGPATVQGTVVDVNLTRAANVVTITVTGSSDLIVLGVGDVIQVLRCDTDPTFIGTFTVTAIVTPGQSYQYNQVGANAGLQAGDATAPSVKSLITLAAGPLGAVRTNGQSVITAAALPSQALPSFLASPGFPPFVTIAGVADASFNGTFPVTSYNNGLGTLTYDQPGLPDSASGGGTMTFGINNPTNRTYAYSYKNSITGAVSSKSPSFTIPPAVNRIPVLYPTMSVDPRLGTVDPQIDTIVWWGTLDGGGDLFHIIDLPLYSSNFTFPGTWFTNALFDVTPDGSLDKTQQAPLINGPPPVGKYLAVGQSRIFIGNLVGAPNQIAYTGYEQILVGRPEETVPPNNRLLLNIGAEAVNGLGILQMGVIAHSATKRMYMLRGSVEDIILNAPVAFSAFLEELPWNMGTVCHDSEQSTPYGLIFWATDRTVQLFDGSSVPSDMSATVYPILRRATPGREPFAKSCYFNWLERDWYGLTFAIDGSVTNNFTIFWALQKDGTIDVFPCNVPMDSMAVLSTPKLQRVLAIGARGLIYNLPVSQDTAGGISDRAIIPATAGQLPAFWRSGYFGNDSPQRSKMFKRGMVVADQDGFLVTKYLVNNVTGTITAPRVIGPDPINGSGFSIGQRANRCSVLINFPPQDVASNLLELTVGAIATSDRL